MRPWPHAQPPACIGGGYHGRVWKLSDNHVGKPANDWWRKSMIRKEHTICSILHAEGVSVPRPHGLFTIKILPDDAAKQKERAAFVMQYLTGRQGNHINTLETHDRVLFDHATDLLRIELEKCKRLGFVPKDTNGYNWIYNSDEDKTYLFDFAMWSYKPTGFARRAFAQLRGLG